jgi:hypothetical protein
MRAVGDKQRGAIRPDFDRSISIDFQGAKITSDTGFLLMREMDQRFNILGSVESLIDDPRSPRHTDHSLLQLLRQRIYQVAAGYEDCNDANHLRVDPNAVDLKTSPAFYAFQSTIYWEDFWLLWAVRLWGVLTYST